MPNALRIAVQSLPHRPQLASSDEVSTHSAPASTAEPIGQAISPGGLRGQPMDVGPRAHHCIASWAKGVDRRRRLGALIGVQVAEA